MEQDPRLWIAALRTAHDRTAGFVAGASADDLAHPSMCAEWTVAQVLGHLGSGAEIALATVTGTPVENQEVWDRWNAKAPADAASSFAAADERLVGWYEGLSDGELGSVQVQLAFLPAPIDVATAAGFRLSEAALHGWDIEAAFDRSAALPPDAAALLVDRLPMMVGFVGRFTPRETRPPGTATIAVTTSEPERRFELEVGDGLDLRPVGDGDHDGELVLPAEALLRLAAGRLHPDQEHGARATGSLTLDQLRTAFPGY